MPNCIRTVKADLWIDKDFREFDPARKVFWFFLHTGYLSSETSLYICQIDDISFFCGLSKKKAKELIEEFEERGFISYDVKTGEILVRDYFHFHPPVGGLYYRMFANDLSKIRSEKLIDELVEISKGYKISMPFFAALQDRRPDLKERDFKIKKTDMTPEDARNADERGRHTAASNRGANGKKQEEEKTSRQSPDSSSEIDELLPF